MSDYTPGPWDYKVRSDPFYFPRVLLGPPDSRGRRASIVVNDGPSPEMVEQGYAGGTTCKTANANARLIAAAPELLEACQLWMDAALMSNDVEMLDWDALERVVAVRDEAMEKTVAAIAKVSGGTKE